MKTYKEIVDDVKAKNPSLNFKEIQIAASEIFKAAKIATDAAAELTKPPVIPAHLPGTPQEVKANIDKNLSEAVDAAIRKEGINRHSLINISHRYNADFHLVLDGKQGVNTKCHLDGPCRVPENGYYLIYL
jgi:hypothetical protein